MQKCVETKEAHGVEVENVNDQMQRTKEYRLHTDLRRLQDKIVLMIAKKEKKMGVQF